MLTYIMAAYSYNEFEHLETNNWMHNLYTTKFYTLATSHTNIHDMQLKKLRTVKYNKMDMQNVDHLTLQKLRTSSSLMPRSVR